MVKGGVFAESIRFLRQYREQYDSIIVAYSGGKDSLCVLDLCCKVWEKVVCYTAYFVPGLECVDKQMRFAKERYGVKILYYPGINLLRCLANGTYCPARFQDLPDDLGPYDVARQAMIDTGINLVANGERKSDSLERRRRIGTFEGIISPIANWQRWDVFAYAKIHDIPLPDSDPRVMTGVNLSMESLIWLHDNHPEDFKKLSVFFPFAEAVIRRRDWYNISGIVSDRNTEDGRQASRNKKRRLGAPKRGRGATTEVW